MRAMCQQSWNRVCRIRSQAAELARNRPASTFGYGAIQIPCYTPAVSVMLALQAIRTRSVSQSGILFVDEQPNAAKGGMTVRIENRRSINIPADQTAHTADREIGTFRLNEFLGIHRSSAIRASDERLVARIISDKAADGLAIPGYLAARGSGSTLNDYLGHGDVTKLTYPCGP